jgi:hypothetical protein
MKSTRAGSTHAFRVCARKTFPSALGRLLQTEFPRTFGPAVTRLFTDKITELFDRCHPPRSRVRVGQVLWLAVAADERPTQSKQIQETRLVPVLLDLVTPDDIHATADAGRRQTTRQTKIVRLFRQAHAQGAVLSQADVALMLHLSDGVVSAAVAAYEQATGQVVPCRGTVHDLGRSVTHKAVICYKRLVEKKPTSQVAQETCHSPEAVEHYVQCLRRIQLCRDQGMTPDDIATATGHTMSLVREYLDLLAEYKLPPATDPP